MNSVISEYKETLQNPAVEPNNDLAIIVSVIIFGAVAIFVGVYVYNFIKGFKYGDNVTTNNIFKKKNNDDIEENYKNNFQSMKTMNKPSIICNACGEENDLGSNFCKNCGSRLQ